MLGRIAADPVIEVHGAADPEVSEEVPRRL
jgi:hypothetical protein